MKRISWLCLCILCACNPTPKKISINDQDRYDKLKKEAMLEEKLFTVRFVLKAISKVMNVDLKRLLKFMLNLLSQFIKVHMVQR